MLTHTPELAAKIREVSRRLFGQEFTIEEAQAHLRALKAVVAADGFSEAEQRAWRAVVEAAGVPKELQDDLEAFDPASVPFEEILRPIPRGSRRARQVLRGGIRIARVDGYSNGERERVMEMAWHLGIKPGVVYALEAMVELEARVKELGHEKLAAMIPPLFHALFESEG